MNDNNKHIVQNNRYSKWHAHPGGNKQQKLSTLYTPSASRVDSLFLEVRSAVCRGDDVGSTPPIAGAEPFWMSWHGISSLILIYIVYIDSKNHNIDKIDRNNST